MEAAVEGTKIKFGTRGAPEGMQKDARDLPFWHAGMGNEAGYSLIFCFKIEKRCFQFDLPGIGIMVETFETSY